MNINIQSITNTFFKSYSGYSHKGLKSTEEKMERQEKRDNEVAFFENQKENLKTRKCTTVEEIAEKLDMLKSYDDQIAGIKAAYNNEQMFHILDEAREMGEKIAEAAEEMEPKTPEEPDEEPEPPDEDQNPGTTDNPDDTGGETSQNPPQDMQEDGSSEGNEGMRE